MTHTTPILLSADFQGADSLRWERLRSVSAGRTVRLPAPAAPVLSPITRARYTVYDLLLTVDHAVRFGSTPQPRTVRLPALRAGVDEANLSRAILWHELRLTPTLPVRLPAPAILR
jgi:hypothetical protein